MISYLLEKVNTLGEMNLDIFVEEAKKKKGMWEENVNYLF